MVGKVKIELTPYDCLAILKFCREYVNEDFMKSLDAENRMVFAPLADALAEYEKQAMRMTESQATDAIRQNEVNRITGKFPKDQITK